VESLPAIQTMLAVMCFHLSLSNYCITFATVGKVLYRLLLVALTHTAPLSNRSDLQRWQRTREVNYSELHFACCLQYKLCSNTCPDRRASALRIIVNLPQVQVADREAGHTL